MARRRRPDGPSGTLFYGLLAVLTTLFFIAAWATLEEETPPKPLAPSTATRTAVPTSTSSPTRVPASPTLAVIVVGRGPPTATPRISPTASPTATSTPQPSATATQSSTATASVTRTNTPTTTPTDTPEPPTPTVAPLIHVVQPGDTLRAIGERYGVGWQAIAAANGLPEDTILRIDQELIIPRPV